MVLTFSCTHIVIGRPAIARCLSARLKTTAGASRKLPALMPHISVIRAAFTIPGSSPGSASQVLFPALPDNRVLLHEIPNGCCCHDYWTTTLCHPLSLQAG